jgi:DnaJ-related protein SCJ1
MMTRRVGPGFIQQFQTTCEKCHGKGKIYSSTCPVCGGRKVEFSDITFDVDIEPGTLDGNEYVFENYADEIPGQTAGHVRLQVATVPHPVFTRDGDDLWMEMDITLREVCFFLIEFVLNKLSCILLCSLWLDSRKALHI